MARNSSRKIILHLLLIFFGILFIVKATGGWTRFLRTMFPVKYTAEAVRYSKQYDLDPYLVLAVIKAESGFNVYAKSHKDAMGLMQLTEGTAYWGAEEIGLKDFTLEDLYEPETNIMLGCWYIRNLLNEFNQDEELAIAAYNGGSGNVKRWLQEKKYSLSGEKLDVIPYKETKEFVSRVFKYRKLYSMIYKLNFS